jgi:hypothetical protein
MPQLEKGGKFVFGWSLIRPDYSIQLPNMAVDEYKISSEGKVIIISGSKSTGGFIVTRCGLIKNSVMGKLFETNPEIENYKIKEGSFIKFKGRNYCWLNITKKGLIKLNYAISDTLGLKPGDRLLSIRGSNIAFVMGAKGRLINIAENYTGEITTY